MNLREIERQIKVLKKNARNDKSLRKLIEGVRSFLSGLHTIPPQITMTDNSIIVNLPDSDVPIWWTLMSFTGKYTLSSKGIEFEFTVYEGIGPACEVIRRPVSPWRFLSALSFCFHDKVWQYSLT